VILLPSSEGGADTCHRCPIDMKTKTVEELKQIVDKARQENKKVVFANGCFDVLHVGHVRYLKDAKDLGDVLIVGLNSDSSVTRLKGKGRPILDQVARAKLLSGLECVDYLVVFEDDTVDRLLIELRPHYHCKGGDYTPENIPEKETIKTYGGSTSITGGAKVQSTRWLFDEIRRRFKD
jgi:D-glycero-beta-D-manno-heptose 1-phosphate adenylyltransferase